MAAAQAAGDATGDRPGRVRRQRTLMLTSAALSVTVLIGSGCAWAFTDYVNSKIKKIAVSGLGGHSGPHGAMNVLVAGVDRRQGIPKQVLKKLHLGYAAGARSDTMMLVHLSGSHNKATVISLPRDSLLNIPGHGRNKLNAAFSWGGPSLTIKTIEHNTGIQIDHYIEINFLAVLKIVDALGGVDVCLPSAVNDPLSGLKMSAGKHHIGGIKALEFVRVRHGIGDGSDLGRIKRQQQFVADLLRAATSSGTVTNPAKFTHFMNASLEAVRADKKFGAGTMRALAKQMRRLTPSDLSFTTVPLSNTDYNAPGVGSSVLWDQTAAHRLFSEIENDQPIIKPAKKSGGKGGSGSGNSGGSGATKPTIPPSRIALSVYNGAGTQGLGAKARQDLQNVGFQVPAIAHNWTSTGLRSTVIEYGPTRAQSAATVKAALPNATLKQVPGLDTVKVILGLNYHGAKPVQVATPTGGSGGGIDAHTGAQDVCD